MLEYVFFPWNENNYIISKNAYDICERKWREQPTTRELVFVISNQTQKSAMWTSRMNEKKLLPEKQNQKQAKLKQFERKIEDISMLFGDLNAREWTHSLCKHTSKNERTEKEKKAFPNTNRKTRILSHKMGQPTSNNPNTEKFFCKILFLSCLTLSSRLLSNNYRVMLLFILSTAFQFFCFIVFFCSFCCCTMYMLCVRIWFFPFLLLLLFLSPPCCPWLWFQLCIVLLGSRTFIYPQYE